MRRRRAADRRGAAPCSRTRNFTSATISLAVVDDATIHELNRQYLDHDWPTDVLSFVLDEHDGTPGRRSDHQRRHGRRRGRRGRLAAGGRAAAVRDSRHAAPGRLSRQVAEPTRQKCGRPKRSYLRQFGLELRDRSELRRWQRSPRSRGAGERRTHYSGSRSSALLAACLTAIAARSLHEFSRHELEEICRAAPDAGALRATSCAITSAWRWASKCWSCAARRAGVSARHVVGCGSQFVAGESSAVAGACCVAVVVLGLIVAVTTVWLPWSIARIAAAQFLYLHLAAVERVGPAALAAGVERAAWSTRCCIG